RTAARGRARRRRVDRRLSALGVSPHRSRAARGRAGGGAKRGYPRLDLPRHRRRLPRVRALRDDGRRRRPLAAPAPLPRAAVGPGPRRRPARAGRDAVGWRGRGPHSAGAGPGPACYGRGGEEPTVTDANLLLGYLDARSPLAGGVELDAGAAERAVGELASALGLSLEDAAAGIVRIASTEMA